VPGYVRPLNLAAVGKPRTVRLRGRMHPVFSSLPTKLSIFASSQKELTCQLLRHHELVLASSRPSGLKPVRREA